MKRGGKALICLICALSLTTGVRAVVNESGGVPPAEGGDSPYSAIWMRNVFDLKPPPTQTEPVKPNTPPPNVKLSGIMTIFGKKQALFLVQEPPAPGKPPSKEESYILSEGQRQDKLEVLEINPKAGTVKIKNEEIVSTITFETNKTSVGPATAPQNMAGGMPPRSPGFGGHPPGLPGSGQQPSTPIPGRALRTTDNSQVSPQGYAQPSFQNTGYGTAVQNASYGAAVQNTSYGATTPGLSLPNAFTQPPSAQSSSIPQETAPPEVTAALLAAQAANAKNRNVPFPPAPPTFEGIPGLPTDKEPVPPLPTTAPPALQPVLGQKGNYIPPGLLPPSAPR